MEIGHGVKYRRLHIEDYKKENVLGFTLKSYSSGSPPHTRGKLRIVGEPAFYAHIVPQFVFSPRVRG